MQLLGQNEGGHQGEGSPRSVSEGEGGPVSPGSSPGSPTTKGNAPREKPVKVLPCPRCESMNTKFCYYNNYSVTQPRHFCRQCQRYWTAGGTLRNVPVGGGSRKKNRHTPRTGEPYLQQQQQQQRAHTAGQFAVPAPPGQQQQQQQQNVGFQQMMAQDQMVPLSFPGFYNNVPGYASLQDPAAYAYNQPELPPMHAMYGTGGGAPYYEMPVVPADNVKPELWTNMPPPPPPPLHQNTGSVLLNLGLNQRWDHQTGAAVMKPKHGSPPHGSSTLEEEGSTPTNGYSNSGYEEGDAVSSMWPSFQHDSDAMFQESMFQLSNPEDQR